MASDYPGAIDSFTDPITSDPLNNPSHASQHTDKNDAIVAIENKVGADASTPTDGKVLKGTGAGNSSWGQVEADDIATDAVETDKIPDEAVTPEKRSGGFSVGSVPGSFSTTGDRTVTGLSFQPRMVTFTLRRHSGADHFTGSGAMDEDGNQFLVAGNHDASANAGGTTSALDGCIGAVSLTGGTIDMKAAFVSMNSDGFTINVSNGATSIIGVEYVAYA